jgi:hypothetical protein
VLPPARGGKHRHEHAVGCVAAFGREDFDRRFDI